MGEINKILYNSKFSYKIIRPIDYFVYIKILAPFIYPLLKKRLMKYHINNRLNTAKKLLHSKKSLGRFGDGELRWMMGNKKGSFEKNSPLLSKRLSEIIKNYDSNFMVSLPDAFLSLKPFNKRSKMLWERFIIKYLKLILPYLNENSIYYDTSVVRPYMDYKDRHYAKLVFNELKKVWNNKNILIIEGAKTRLGVGNDLFNNAKQIKRIECPVNYAFESYKRIYNNVISFLFKHKSDNYITLISLGPTATVLSYDIYKQGFRAIDIGHIDLEYTWFLMGATRPINISYKYTNESHYDKNPSKRINNKKYLNEIINIIQ